MKKVFLIFLISILLFSCKGQKKTSVILISIDGLGSDYIQKTEYIKDLANKSIYFENAITPYPLCLPAHTSILTSTDYNKNRCFLNEFYYLKNDIKTISQVFTEKGYNTYSFVSGKPLKKLYGLQKGSGIYNDSFFQGKGKNLLLFNLEKENATFYPEFREAKETLDLAKEKISVESRPFFLFIHLYDLYPPLYVPEQFSAKYPQDPYLASLSYIDNEIAKFLKEFEKKDIIIILTSDHGKVEDPNLYMGLEIKDLKVPIILKFPEKFKVAEKTIKNPISLLDISPTILSFLKIRDKEFLNQSEGEDLKNLIINGKEKEKKIFVSNLIPYHYYGKNPLFFEVDKNLNLKERKEIAPIFQEESNDFYTSILKVQELLKVNNLKESALILNKFYQSHQNSYIYLKTLFLEKTMERDLVGIEKVIQKLQENFGESPEMDFEIYKKYLIFGEREKAITFLYEMMKKYQSFPYLVEEALSLEEIKRPEDFKNFIKKIPEPIEDCTKDILEGIKYLIDNNKEKAAEYFKIAIDKGANSPVPYFQLGIIFKKEGKIKEALTYLYAAYMLNNNNPRFIYELADTFAILGDFEKAYNFFKRSYELQPANFSIIIGYLKTSFLTGKKEDVQFLKNKLLKNYYPQTQELINKDILLKEIISGSP